MHFEIKRGAGTFRKLAMRALSKPMDIVVVMKGGVGVGMALAGCDVAGLGGGVAEDYSLPQFYPLETLMYRISGPVWYLTSFKICTQCQDTQQFPFKILYIKITNTMSFTAS